MKNKTKEKVAVVRESFYKITGNALEALLLNQMVYWARRVKDYDSFIKEENSRTSDDSLKFGWIHKTAAEIRGEIMSDASRTTIQRKLDCLVNKGYMSRRKNPKHAYDRTYQYRVNLKKIINDLNALGYKLDDFEDIKQNEHSCAQNEQSSVHSEFSNMHGEHSSAHSEQTIPETTTYITSDITSSSVPEEETGESSLLLKTIGINNLTHKTMIEPISSLIANLYRTGKVGRKRYSKSEIKKTLSTLTARDIDSILDRYFETSQKGEIINGESFLSVCLLSKGKEKELLSLAGKTQEKEKPSFDVDEYVRLSMERVMRG